MKTAVHSYPNVHPMVVFWIGLLTGAVIVGLAFFYRTLVPADYNSSLFKFSYPTYSTNLKTNLDTVSIKDPMG